MLSLATDWSLDRAEASTEIIISKTGLRDFLQGRCCEWSLDVFYDGTWGGGGESSISTHGYNVFLFGCPIGWMSWRQACVATSTCHSEYTALGASAREMVWVINVLEEVISFWLKSTIYCNNTAAVKATIYLHITLLVSSITWMKKSTTKCWMCGGLIVLIGERIFQFRPWKLAFLRFQPQGVLAQDSEYLCHQILVVWSILCMGHDFIRIHCCIHPYPTNRMWIKYWK